jgi:hypothetical protein
MATTPNSIITVQTPRMGAVGFSTADTAGTNKTIIQGGSNGTKVTALYANSNDTGASHLGTVQFQRNGANFGGVAVTIPVSAGFANGTPPVNFMSTAVWPGLPIDSDGNPFLFLASTLDIIVGTFATAMGAGFQLNMHAVAGDF